MQISSKQRYHNSGRLDGHFPQGFKSFCVFPYVFYCHTYLSLYLLCPAFPSVRCKPDWTELARSLFCVAAKIIPVFLHCCQKKPSALLQRMSGKPQEMNNNLERLIFSLSIYLLLYVVSSTRWKSIEEEIKTRELRKKKKKKEKAELVAA